jgi:F-type H+-transporting ATPase subunit b
MDILRQLGGLLLGSVPTIILFILLVIAYGMLVRRPLVRVLSERRERTTGAVEQARGAISAAEAETAVYEDKLRAARAEILAAREGKLAQLQAQRDAALEGTRSTAQEKIRAARKEIEDSAVSARRQIETASAQLSESIVRALLPAGERALEVHQ